MNKNTRKPMTTIKTLITIICMSLLVSYSCNGGNNINNNDTYREQLKELKAEVSYWESLQKRPIKRYAYSEVLDSLNDAKLRLYVHINL